MTTDNQSLSESSTTSGYQPDFLGTEPVPVPSDPRLTVLDYTHFSIHQDTERRMPAITAVNIDGASLVTDIERGNNWRLDPRLPAEHQAGEELYARNDIDRGHLVRRRDPVWGERQIATQANADTFHYTVCAPQAGYFNQSKELWLGLEDHVLEHAATFDQRLSVFTGCVFTAEDPSYRGFLVPRQFFKIAAWNRGGELAASAYVLDQGEGLDMILRRGLRPGQEAGEDGPGPFKTFQIPVADVASLTGLPVDQLAAADVLGATLAQRPAFPDGRRRWIELGGPQDLVLG